MTSNPCMSPYFICCLEALEAPPNIFCEFALVLNAFLIAFMCLLMSYLSLPLGSYNKVKAFFSDESQTQSVCSYCITFSVSPILLAILKVV